MSDVEQRIRERAYRIWLEEGCSEGRANDHWDMATELVAIEDGQRSAVKPINAQRGPSGEPVEPIEAVQNVGEFPTMTDQSEGRYPEPRSGKRFGRSGNDGS